MTSRILSLVVLLVALCTAQGTTLRVYMLGNSLTDNVNYGGFRNLATQGNDTVTIGSQRIPGAPISWLWTHPGDGFADSPYGGYTSAFANYQWDAITLQPFSTRQEELTHARYFLRAVQGRGGFGPGVPSITDGGTGPGISPNAIVYIYAVWPVGTVAGWRPDYWLGGNQNATRSARAAESIVEELRELEPTATVRLIPVGHVFHELHTQLRAGRIPGLTRHPDFMLDGTHLNEKGSYVAGVTFYTTIFQEDPRGRGPVGPYTVTAEQALAIQEAAWRVVSRHPLAGLATTTVITTPSLPDAVVGSSYSTTLATAFAQGSVTWSLVGGALPNGMSLSSNGVISGTTEDVGIYDIRIRALDSAGKFDDRDYILFVVTDDPPVIKNAALPQATIGAPYRVVFQHEGGQGEGLWELEAGELPRGLTLGADGILQGTPVSVEGYYMLTFKVTDSLGSSASATMALLLTAPEEGTLIVAPAASAPVTDGALTEALWADMVPVQLGADAATDPQYSVRWDTNALYVGVRVPDQGTPSNDDTLHLFIDGRHDREAVFNADDRNIVIHRTGAWQEHNSRPEGIEVATKQEGGNWTTEIRIPWTNLSKEPDGQSFAVGMDIAVNLTNAASGPRTYSWNGTDLVDPSPATMGNLLLSAAPIKSNLLVNGNFDGPQIFRPSFPGTANTSYAGNGWSLNGVPDRPFGRIDGTGYGYPQLSVIPYSAGTSAGAYQVIHDGKATKGQGYVRFDAKYPTNAISYRLFGFNGTPENVNARIGTGNQQNPPAAGTPDATLLTGTLTSSPDGSVWREVVLPVNFGNGYDYLILVFTAGSSAAHPDSRMDNVEMGAASIIRQVTGKPAFAPNPDVLLQASFIGTNPSMTVPWTATHQLHSNLTYSGIRASSAISRVAGNDGYHYHGNHGSTTSTLEWTFSQNQYLEFELTAKTGTFSLEDAVLQIQVDRLNNDQSAARYALFSSVGGFGSVANAVSISPAVGKSGIETIAFTLPSGAAYRDLTKITFRLYAFQGIYAAKTMALKGLALIGNMDEPPPPPPVDVFAEAYESWRSSINWQGGDDTPFGDANGDGLANIVAFALALPSPLADVSAQLLPDIGVTTDGGQRKLVIPHRRRAGDNGIKYSLEVSNDLQTWTTASAAGLTEVKVNANVDGDGKAELWEFRMPWGSENTQFVRLAITPVEVE